MQPGIEGRLSWGVTEAALTIVDEVKFIKENAIALRRIAEHLSVRPLMGLRQQERRQVP